MRALLGTLIWFGAGIALTAGLVQIMTPRGGGARNQGLLVEEAQLQQSAALDRRSFAANERVKPKIQ